MPHSAPALSHGSPPDVQDAKDAYQHAHPAAAQVASPFAGKGIFTAWDNHAAIGLKADWVAVQLDPEGKGAESIGSLKEYGGYRYVYGWQARPDLDGVLTARTRGLDGYIGQAENEAEYEACLGLGKLAGLPHALVGNCGDWWNGARVADLGWELILEAYEGADPGVLERLDSKGYPVASTLYGCYDATSEQPGGRRVPLAEYRLRYPVDNWSVYLAETLTPADRELLA